MWWKEDGLEAGWAVDDNRSLRLPAGRDHPKNKIRLSIQIGW